MGQLRFIRIDGQQEAAEVISAKLNSQLETGRTILLLLAGGSAVPLAVSVRQMLKNENRLAISLTDERYGPVGHKDSNWTQLQNAGFDFSGLRVHPILNGKDIAQTADEFDSFLKYAPDEFDYITAILGMGADGHTSGILPDSGLSLSESCALSYQADDYSRITTTPRFLSRLEEAFVYAIGDAKHRAIDDLVKSIDIEQQPVQIIKSINKVMFFNDYKGEGF